MVVTHSLAHMALLFTRATQAGSLGMCDAHRLSHYNHNTPVPQSLKPRKCSGGTGVNGAGEKLGFAKSFTPATQSGLPADNLA